MCQKSIESLFPNAFPQYRENPLPDNMMNAKMNHTAKKKPIAESSLSVPAYEAKIPEPGIK